MKRSLFGCLLRGLVRGSTSALARLRGRAQPDARFHAAVPVLPHETTPVPPRPSPDQLEAVARILSARYGDVVLPSAHAVALQFHLEQDGAESAATKYAKAFERVVWQRDYIVGQFALLAMGIPPECLSGAQFPCGPGEPPCPACALRTRHFPNTPRTPRTFN